jgi:hypothetical protein
LFYQKNNTTMKLPVLVAIFLTLAGGSLIVFIVVNPFKEADPRIYSAEKISTLNDKDRESYFSEVLLSTRATPDNKILLVKWGMLNEPAFLEAFLRENARRITNFPGLLSSASIDLVREGKGEQAVSLMNLGGELFPNSPEILGAMGITAFLQGRQEEARLLLEQAESWRLENPLVDFYLGAVLIQSDSTADLTRGKSLLMRVMNRKDEELSELAAFALLTAPGIPLIKADYKKIFDTLDELNALRPDNSNLNAEVMRILTDQALQFSPEHALDLALLLFKFPDVTIADRLNSASLAQTLGHVDTAGEILGAIDESSLVENPAENQTYNRLSAVQLMLEGSFTEGLSSFRSLVESRPDMEQLTDSFQIAFRHTEMPLETERAMLELFLKLPVSNVPLTIAVLNRLVELAPLQKNRWVDYAIETLLPVYTGVAAQWLTQQGEPMRVIEALSASDQPLETSDKIALIEAYLAVSDPGGAQAILKSPGAALPQALAEFYYARCALQMGQEEEAFERWKASQNAALSGNSFPMMKNLGFLALELDQPVNALQALYTAFNAGIEFSQNQLGRLLQLTLENGTLNQTIKIAEALEDSYPEEPVYQNNLAYFRFLANTSLEDSVATMRELVEDYPDVNQYRLTLALGLLKIGRNNEAKRLLESTSIDWNDAGTRGKMIYAAVLAANNQRVVAEGLIANIEFEDLIPEERALLESN